ncbi:2,3-diaminopropionate biosynthesis protein SbnA [Streptomyces cyaneofuscatus]|uniref:2,3-diaminopropionate biosynthesis protein SbnA n=1 Tax=Streptomyces TaxID=1883 RepID=UPI0004C8477A|nr:MULTISPECIES: 2,3-diaminopropionate biosynthesis protein SbnA [Streptomyces]ONI49024.1 putative siderophore biosynthesis protein SbnA [Streptomyces sp. IB2014 011-1]RDV47048.1 2,3-diaminopropionate biosynthesis protein SbnA [Streptomyces sp. IB2014 011-12]CAD5918102.1 N-(2-amino-2-carboxyethyl)-L-glutamate synthase [Streptomyces sp. KY70]CAD5992231.1 N-(2-amino-2-carboxyethyl)-L-glutamate synthase [Streptomyces sp. KY75]
MNSVSQPRYRSALVAQAAGPADEEALPSDTTQPPGPASAGYGPDRTGALSAVGGTPLVELTRLVPGARFRVWAKLESVSTGGSIKDRSAYAMLSHAVVTGAVVPGSGTVIESSSGNLGVGMAQACRAMDLRFICVVDPRTNPQNIAIMRALGADVHTVTEGDPITGEFQPVRIARVRELVDALPGAYWPNQYANPRNAWAHRITMAEIVEDLGAAPDYLFCTISSSGTLRGCGDLIHDRGLPTRVVTVDAEGSAIFRPPTGRRLIPGHGAAVRPPLYRGGLADEVVHVSDLDSLVGCRRLALREGLLLGGSSGAVATALQQMGDRIPDGATCVLMMPDRGERYLNTIYDDGWVERQFGEVSHLWKDEVADVAENSGMTGVAGC